MKLQTFCDVPCFFRGNSSTLPFGRKSAKVQNLCGGFFAVEMCRNCGVEREKFLKILWKNRRRTFYFHSLWNQIFLKKWKYLTPHCKRTEISGKLFNSTFNMLLKVRWKAVDFQIRRTYPLYLVQGMCTAYAVGGLGFFSRMSLIISSTSSLRFASFFSAVVTLLIA